MLESTNGELVPAFTITGYVEVLVGCKHTADQSRSDIHLRGVYMK